MAFVALGAIWGSNFIFMKWASETISPAQDTTLRVVFGLVPGGCLWALRGLFARRQLRYTHHYLVMSVLATSVYYFAFAAGTALLPSGIAGALSGAIPLFSFIAGAALLRDEPMTLARLLGVLTGFAGVLLVARPLESTGAVDLRGVAYMLLGSTSVGLSLCVRQTVPDQPRHPTRGADDVPDGAGGDHLAHRDGPQQRHRHPERHSGDCCPRGRAWPAWHRGGLILYYCIVGALGAVTASSVTFIPPIVALAIGFLMVGEPVTWVDAAAVGLILLGVLALRRRSPPSNDH